MVFFPLYIIENLLHCMMMAVYLIRKMRPAGIIELGAAG